MVGAGWEKNTSTGRPPAFVSDAESVPGPASVCFEPTGEVVVEVVLLAVVFVAVVLVLAPVVAAVGDVVVVVAALFFVPVVRDPRDPRALVVAFEVLAVPFFAVPAVFFVALGAAS